ncbi:hypothetical protein Adt_42058 [Abeliophyllum distichum]|uniref:Uncharacterized protein n=1 Tax=Abeliophyllum distichum TaxID=126358 RepID=A0ABD1PRH3_9LAMI
MPCLDARVNQNNNQLGIDGSLATEFYSTIQIEVEKSYLDQNQDLTDIDHHPVHEEEGGKTLEENFNPLNDYQLARDREMSQIRPPLRFHNLDFVYTLTIHDSLDLEPNSYEQAIGNKQSKI